MQQQKAFLRIHIKFFGGKKRIKPSEKMIHQRKGKVESLRDSERAN